MTKLIQLSTFLFVCFFSMPSSAFYFFLKLPHESALMIELTDNEYSFYTILDLKTNISHRTRIPVVNQKLLLEGKTLMDDTKISNIINKIQGLVLVNMVDNISEARNNFRTYLRNGDHEMAYMTALSIIDRPHRYTTGEIAEANSWLKKLSN